MKLENLRVVLRMTDFSNSSYEKVLELVRSFEGSVIYEDTVSVRELKLSNCYVYDMKFIFRNCQVYFDFNKKLEKFLIDKTN